MSLVTFRVSGPNLQLEAALAMLPMSRIDKGSIVLVSQLAPESPLNDHLVWLWGMLQNERRFLKSAASAGASLTFECKGIKGPIRLLPNGAEAIHLLGAELLLNAK